MWLSLAALFAALGSGVIIGACLGIAAMMLMYVYFGTLVGLMESAWQIMFSFSLASIPCYILLGEIFIHSGLSNKVYGSLGPLLERFPAKLLTTNTVVCAIFGAISGSSIATAAAIGSVAYPEQKERGYDKVTVVGNLAGSGTLGLLIPPSFTLILYGAFTGVSVGDLFIAAVIPGILLASLFVTFISAYCKLNPSVLPRAAARVPLPSAIWATRNIWPMGILIFCVLGTIYLGMATPTEAAGLGVVAAIMIAAFSRSFSLRKLYDAGCESAKVLSMIGIVVVGAIMFSVAVSTLGVPRQAVLEIGALGLSPTLVKLLVYLLYLVLGCFIDATGMLLMTLPFTFPLMLSIGADPLWFGVVLVLVTEMGLLTPPVGINLYVLQGITGGEVTILEVAKGALPYFLLQGVLLAMITIWPQLCLWLPAQMSY